MKVLWTGIELFPSVALELGAGSQALSSDSCLHTHTYSVQANVILVAANYALPTSRRRLYLFLQTYNIILIMKAFLKKRLVFRCS